MKRRCLYHWIPYPTLDKELTIVRSRLPHIEENLAAQVVKFVQKVREMDLSKPPGVVETLDTATALAALGCDSLDANAAEAALGCVAKSSEDFERLKASGVKEILSGL